MLKQIRYFQSVVRLGSFTAAAEEHYISQSAISQQIKALEDELGVRLLDRKKRSFKLTEAGEFFYKKSLVLVSDYDAICKQLQNIAKGGEETLRVGLLKGYRGREFQAAVARFSAVHPDVSVKVTHGCHDALYDLMRRSELDLVLNDQRRAFSDEYVNIVLDICEYHAEISAASPLAALKSVEVSDLKNLPLILLANEEQRETERRFFAEDMGFQSEISFSEYLDDAYMQVVQGRGFMLIEGSSEPIGDATCSVKLTRSDQPIIRRYCAFCRLDSMKTSTEKFIDILKEEF
ncbi:LysR family transcriptional regulator [Ruminococcus sp.]|uniref:LysR family transcriptional regulator n=1 Tax=Ruminococcus sp. TaxID=41978 RepID=UPI0025F7D197|nr:LysR family transcriptional regulator [Ruminococcus sp.]MBQ8966444.1 LysR family transcriptional regulator [Ruminococcus sp.]